MLTMEQLYGILRSVGFDHESAITFTAIAKAESGLNPQALNPRGEYSVGLFQINMRAHGTRFGTEAQLYDPVTNAKAAYVLSNGGKNLRPWTVTHAGNPNHYSKHLAAARRAAGAWDGSTDFASLGQSSGGGFAPASSGNAAPNPQEERLELPSGGSFIRAGGQLYVAYRFYGNNNKTGRSAVVYYRLNANQLPKGANVVTMSEQKIAEYRASGQWVDGGSAEALRGIPKGKSFQDLVNDTLMQLGLAGTDALNDQGVMNIVALAMTREMSAEELANRLRGTDWYQARTDAEREWNDLSKAEQDQRIVDQAMQLAGLYFTYVGKDLQVHNFDRNGDGFVSADELKRGNPDLYKWASQVASGKATQSQAVNVWLKGLASEDPDSPWSRTLREEEKARGQHTVDIENMGQQIRELYWDWGLPISDKTLREMAENVVMNKMSMADIQDDLRKQAAALYPHKPEWMSTRQWAQPYMQMYMNTLETPEVELDDALLQRGLTEGLTLTDFRKMLRADDRWLNTENARVEFNNKISDLGRVMGF